MMMSELAHNSMHFCSATRHCDIRQLASAERSHQRGQGLDSQTDVDNAQERLRHLVRADKRVSIVAAGDIAGDVRH